MVLEISCMSIEFGFDTSSYLIVTYIFVMLITKYSMEFVRMYTFERWDNMAPC